ncbi:MAG: inositol monophosphatase [Gammaproteobacteria bacterium]
MLPDIKELQELITQAARQELLARFAEASLYHKHEHKPDGSIVSAADIAMQRFMKIELAQRWPQYGFLGEEMPAHEQQQIINNQQKGFWCLDPLDGTSNFAAGIPFFAVALALIMGGEIVIGLVYDPMSDECFTAQKGQGAWLNGKRLQAGITQRALSESIAVVDFKRLAVPLAIKLVTHPPYYSQRNFGSVALEWCWLAAGRFHVYLHGQQKLWDYAAGSLILSEAGGHALTLEGTTIGNDGLESCSAVAAHDSGLFEEWKDWLQANH